MGVCIVWNAVVASDECEGFLLLTEQVGDIVGAIFTEENIKKGDIEVALSNMLHGGLNIVDRRVHQVSEGFDHPF